METSFTQICFQKVHNFFPYNNWNLSFCNCITDFSFLFLIFWCAQWWWSFILRLWTGSFAAISIHLGRGDRAKTHLSYCTVIIIIVVIILIITIIGSCRMRSLSSDYRLTGCQGAGSQRLHFPGACIIANFINIRFCIERLQFIQLPRFIYQYQQEVFTILWWITNGAGTNKRAIELRRKWCLSFRRKVAAFMQSVCGDYLWGAFS